MHTTISSFILREFHADKPDLTIGPDEDLLAANLLGSMDMMRLIAFLEEEFDFRVEPQDMTIENFITVGAMAEYIGRAKAA